MSQLPFPIIGVSAVVFDAHERVLLVCRAKPPALGKWHLPGGRLERGESLVEACQREVREETGLEIEVGPVMAVVERRLEGYHYVIVDFLAHLIDTREREPEAGDDVSEAAWVSPESFGNYPVAEGLLPILESARRAHRGEALGLTDGTGAASDFIAYR